MTPGVRSSWVFLQSSWEASVPGLRKGESEPTWVQSQGNGMDTRGSVIQRLGDLSVHR